MLRHLRLLFAFSLLCGLAQGAAAAADLGSGRLVVAGTRLTVSPESQTVPFDTPTVVETHLVGFDPALGTLPSDLRVLADFTGPEIAGVLVLETRPNEPFRIPRLSLRGDYQLDNIRLVEGDQLLGYAEPRSAAILVTEVLVTRVESRALTLDEIRSYGIVVDPSRMQAFNFTFAFAVGGDVFDYEVPIAYVLPGPENPFGRLEALSFAIPSSRSSGTVSQRFQPPQLAPFTLELAPTGGGYDGLPNGGCIDPDGDCEFSTHIPLPGIILFPTDVSLLHQFFSVVLFAKNDSPAGDPLVIRDLTARAVLPPGLRQAETNPPTPLGVPVPVRVPGADGKLGTADDLTFMVAQSTGQAEVLVEGVQEGTHIVDFELEGVLEGMPTGVQRLTGRARGAVVVRDPTLSVTISHPDVVRTDDEYSLILTVTNTSAAPVNLLSLTLPLSGLSGVEVVGSNERSIETLLSGEAKVVDFRLRSLRTGRVVASAVRSGSVVSPHFEFRVGIGDGDIPLSPTSIVLPRSTQELPPELTRSALGLLGLGFSLATMPAGTAAGDLPRVGRQQVDDHAYSLAQAGRHVALGEPVFDAVALLAAEWTGARTGDWEWDRLRRSTRTGAEVGAKFAAVLATEVPASSPAAVHRRLAADVAPLRVVSALVVGNGASLEVTSRASGRQLRGIAGATGTLRDLPFADLLSLGSSQLALLARPEETGYQLRVRSTGGACDLQVVYLGANNQPAVATWSNVSLGASGSAVVDVLTGAPPSVLYVDHGGDGIVDEQLPASLSSLEPRTFRAIAAVQNPELDPSAHVVEVLFSEDIDIASLLPRDPGRFEIPGKVSNGGLVAQEEHIAHIFGGEDPIQNNPFAGMRNSRVVRAVFDNPISPYVESVLTVRNVRSASGQQAATVALPVVTNALQPGAIVEGTVYGPDGNPAPFAQVGVYETDSDLLGLAACDSHLTAAMRADSQGRFRFDYVRQRPCGDTFTLKAQDPVSGHFGTALGRVRFAGQVQRLDIVMLGRGTIRGTVTYEDGSVPGDIRVLANSPVFAEARQARVDAQGRYEVGDVPVGTVTLLASDRDGNFVLQTVEIPRAGAVTERNLVIVRRPPEEQTGTGQVRGTIVRTDGTTPVADAYVALQIDGVLHGVARSAFDGRFDFGTVPAGLADIEAFDGESGLAGAQVVFDVHADQVNDVQIILRDDRGTIEGYVYRRSGATTTPVAGAVVWATGTPFNTRTDAAGFYRLEGVFAGDRTITAADLVRNVQTSSPVSLTGNGGVVRRDLYFLEETIRGGIAGEVLGFDGTPVSGATIHLAAGPYNWHHEAHTDSTGRFTIPNLGPGSYAVHAYKTANAGASRVVSIRWDGETAWASLRFKKGTVRGVVRAKNGSGDPVGVRALVVYKTTVERYGLVDLDVTPHTLETNDDGTFEIPNVLAGPYTMTIVNALYGEKKISSEIVFHGEVDEHELLFETNGEIRGVVLDHDGVTPVAGAKVDLRHPALAVYDLHTDAQGAFRFALVPPAGGSFPIDALYEHGSRFRQARVWVQLNRYGQELDVRIVLPKQGIVSGWVEDSNGDPVPGAVVTLQEEAFPHRQLVHNADGSGYYSFTNIFAGRVTVSAKAPTLGGLGGKTTAEVTTEGEEVFTLVTLEATGEVEGRVLSPVDGSPVANAEVKLYRWGGFFDSATSDATGSFRFRLLPLATYEVWAFDPRTGRFGRRTGYVVNGNAVVASNDVTLEVRGEVEGHVLEPRNGTGIAGATVELSTRSLVHFTTYSSSDVNGYFEFFGIPEGGFTLYTREPGGRRQARANGLIDEEGERVTVDLTLEAMGRVVGRVLNPAGVPDGNFPNANTLISQDGQVVGATLDNPFAFDGLIAEHGFSLTAQEVGGSHRAYAVGRIVDPTHDLQLDLRMVPIGSAQVAVRDSFGTLLPGAEVTLWSSGFYGWRQLSGSTGAQGAIRFDGIGAGNLSAAARDPNTGLRGSASGTISLEGQVALLEVRLQDSGSIRGRVVMPDGVTPAVDALIVVNAAGKSLRTTAGGDGAFELTAVPMGAFDVFVQEHEGAASRQARGALTSNGQVVDLGLLVLDDRDPYVVSFVPETGSRDLAANTVVTIRFSEPVDRARFYWAWIAFRKLNGDGVGWNASWADGDATLVLTPTAPLASFTGYEVIAGTAVVDLAGRPMADPVRTVFYTRDVVAPTVIDVLPRDGQSQVPLNANLVVTFSEPIEFASLSGPAFQLTDLTTGAGVGTTFQQRPGRREVLLTPVGGLQTDRQYRLTVQGVRDDGGNVMTGVSTTTFWSVDTVPPVIVSVAPAEGTSFTAGDAIVFTIQATDARGLGKATVGVNGWEFTDPAAPYEVTALAPPVESVADVDFTVTVYDAAGNPATLVRSLEVVPRSNGNAPRIDPLCLRDGDFVEPGQVVELAFAVADDEAVESATVRLDGQVLKAVALVGSASSEVRVNWMPPANAAPGTTFTAEVAVRDFARNVTTRTLQLAVPPEPILTGTRVIDASYAGRTLYLSRGTFLVREQVTLAGLNVLAGATVRGDHGLLDLRATGPMRVQCRGSLDASATGYAGGDAGNPVGRVPAGVRGSSPDAGGSHGGVGVAWGMAGPAGEVYDSVYEPSLGGGGASYAYGAAGRPGGGVIRIEAAALSLSGEVRARGGYEDGYSGGGGGTVVVHAATISGNGTIDASGANGYTCHGNSRAGAGGGGRVALHGDLNGFDAAAQVKAWGGKRYCDTSSTAYAAPGTIYTRASGESYGALRVDAGKETTGVERIGAATELPKLGSGAVANWAASGADALLSASPVFDGEWLGAWVVVLDAGGQELGAFRVAEVLADGRARLAGAGTVSGAASYRGEYRFDRFTLANGAGVTALDRVWSGEVTTSGSARLPAELGAGSVTVPTGSVVTPATGSGVSLKVSGTLTVESGARLDVSGFGYAGGTSTSADGKAPAGVRGSSPDAGGSHGGVGVSWGTAGPAGEVYDSVYEPSQAGGGAAYAYGAAGQAGGGVIRIEAGTLSLLGELRARGGYLDGYSGGGGGTVVVHAATISGSGAIDASGADGHTCHGNTRTGGGGGGRVALHGDFAGFDAAAQVKAWGGKRYCDTSNTAYAAPGTIFTRASSETYGRLLVDAGKETGGTERVGPPTELPRLGSGSLTGIQVDGTGLWIERAGGFRVDWVGAWVYLLDVGGARSGPFQVVRVDATGRALLALASSVTAVAYESAYLFDNVALRNGAGLQAHDPVSGQSVVFEGDAAVAAEVVASSVTVRAGSRVHPQAGGELSFKVSGTLTVEAGGVIDVSGAGYPGASSAASPVGGAPAGVVGSAPDAGGSHGGAGMTWGMAGPAGEVYDSVYEPQLGGGGGSYTWAGYAGAGTYGKAGGGVLRIEAGTLALAGELRARGAAEDARAAGAGGTIVVRATTISGGGLIDASGGNGYTCYGGGRVGAGGGGRVALYADFSDFDPALQVKAWGGKRYCDASSTAYAAPGTIYTRNDSDTYGALLVDAGKENGVERTGPATELPRLGSGAVATWEATAGGDALLSSAAGFDSDWTGVWVVLGSAAGETLGSFRVAEVRADGRLRLVGAGAVVGASQYRGEYRFDRLTLVQGAGLTASDPVQGGDVRTSGNVRLPAELGAGSVTVPTGSVVTPATGSGVSLKVSGTLTVESGARLDVSGFGYAGGTSTSADGKAPAGVRGSSPDAGGSHGGVGVSWGTAGPAGEVYDSVYEPSQAGGGAAYAYGAAGQAGGGVIRIEAGTLSLLGELRARGGYLDGYSGGGGGTVVVHAATISGSGAIDASGADGHTCHGNTRTGGGGGGRVALHGDFAGFDAAAQVKAWGGKRYCDTSSTAYAAPGTIYTRRSSDTYGVLLVDAGKETSGTERVGRPTELPRLGSGSLAGIQIDGTGLWIERAAGFRADWVGAWVYLSDASGVRSGPFQVVRIDANGRALVALAASSTAVSYEGAYLFDNVSLRNGAGLTAQDPLTGQSVVFEGDAAVAADVVATSVLVKAGSRVHPQSGSTLRFKVTGTLTVEAGGLIDVTGYGYAAGTSASPEGKAPAGVRGSSPDAGGSHGGVGVAWWLPGPAGDVYDSVYEPSLGGGGASYAYYAAGKAGGGVIQIEAGTLSLLGELRARGGYEDGYSGGGGGTVVVHAATISGTGTIDASGANGYTCYGGARTGAGGGGRVALHGNLDGFDPALQVKALGGKRYCDTSNTAYAAPGTIFTRASGETYGALRVDAGKESTGVERIGPVTELPKLGEGVVAAWAVSGADALLSASPVFDGEWLGAWVVVLDGAGQELGAFRVAEVLVDGRARLAAAGAVSGAASYRGEYRFDRFTLANGAGVTALDRVWSGEVRTSGSARLPVELGAGSVTVPTGSVVTPATGSGVSLKVSGTLTVESGARLDVSGFGYAGGTSTSADGKAPAGVRGSAPDAGGSHGGVGVTWGLAGPAGEVYDSVYEPSLAGGGAAYAYGAAGQAGGGVIRIEAGTLSLLGELRARGGYLDGYSGGGGGTVVVHAATIAGTGSIDASGAEGHTCYGNARAGGGGGGRVALHGNLSGFDAAAQVKAWGGKRYCDTSSTAYAAPGTIYTRASGETYGALHVDAGKETTGVERIGAATELPRLGEGAVANWTVSGADALLSASPVFDGEWLGAWVVVLDAAGQELGVFRVAEVLADGRARLAGAGTVSGAASYRGEYRFDRFTLLNGAGVTALDRVWSGEVRTSGSARLPAELGAGSVTVPTGSVVTPATGSGVSLKVSGTLTVESGARLDVSGFGYAGGTSTSADGKAPAGVRGSAPDAGGSHGGVGVSWGTAGPAGEVYDSVYEPSLGGGGASYAYGAAGRAGGGVIRIEAGTLSLLGELRARGGYEDGYSGGGGGTVVVHAATISGTGSIDASGANGYTCYGNARAGGGGGGRVALHGDFAGFNAAAQVKAWGGKRYCDASSTAYAAPGTIYTRASADTYGRLIVTQPPPSSGPALLRTVLPTIGKGTIGAIASGTGGVWITPAAADAKFSLGVVGLWVRINGTDYQVLDQSADRRSLLLQASSGAFAVGDRYLGVYKFDSVAVKGGATLELRDGEVVGSFDVDAGATVVHLDLTPPAITVTQPAIGTVFRSGDPIAIAATVTDNVAVTAVTFQLGEQSVTDTTSPYTWSVAAPVVETEGDIPLVVTATDAEANSTQIEHPVHVRPLAPSAPPTVSYTCPSTAALVVPGTQLEVFVGAAHDNGIEKVDFFLGTGETPVGTVFTAPYRYTFAIPAAAQEGTSVLLRARARSFAGTTAEATLTVPVVAGQVFTGTAQIGATDTTYDGQTIVASTGTLSIAGTHTFRDLIVLDGATVNHPATTTTAEGRLEVTLSRHLFVACGGAIDVSGRGYLGGNPRGYSYPNTTAEGAAANVGGSHGGRGGNFDGSGRIYDSVFDPRYPGAGGGGGSSKAGGGVVRITAADMAIDGAIRASGDSSGSAAPFGAGGSIRLDAASIGGLGVVQANGGGSAASSSSAGGGGRIALRGDSVDAGLLSRVAATGGDANTTARRGAAGTIFVKGSSDTFGQLIVDNRGIDSTQMTELPALGAGIVDAVTATSVTDNEGDFAHTLVGLDVFFNGNSAELWNVTGHAHHGTTLDLQVAGHALTAQPGNEYRGLYRFDRVVVRGKARVTTADRVTSTATPEVESGAQWQPEYSATVAITAPAVGAHVTAGAAIGAAADATSNLGIASVTFELVGTPVVDTTSPYSASFTAPAVATTTGFELKATARDLSGRKFVQTRTVFVDPSFDPNAPQVTLGACPADGDLVAAGSAHTISFTVTDNENVSGYTVLVNGSAIAQNDAVNQPSTSSSVSWTVPAGAAAGSTFTVRVEGRDFSGGLGFAEVVLTVPATPPLTGTQNLTAAHNGQSLVLGTGTFTVTAPLSLASLTLMNGAVVKGTAGADLRLDVAGTARVQCGATLTGTALGYAGAATSSVKGGAPAGLLGSATDTGGSHAGPGVAHDGGIPGETYDSVYVPFLAGGGGSYESTAGGAGGGVLQLKAAELVLYGTISALGEKRGHAWPYRGGAGGGGSILIETGTLRGKGLIDASGGSNEACEWWSGAGGGGRVAVYADTLSFDPVTQTKAWGGGVYYCGNMNGWRYAGAGTVFVKTSSSTYGSLYVDSGLETNSTKRLGADVQLPVLGTGAVTAVEVSGSNLWVTQSTAFKSQWLGAWMVLVDGAGVDLGGFRVQEMSGNRVLLTGAGAIAGAASFRGEYRFDAVTVRNGARVVTPDRMVALDFEAKSGEVWLPSKTVVRNLTIRNGATVMSAGEVLDLTVTEVLTIDSGGVLSVTGKGYPGAATSSAQGGAPAGVTGSTSDTGGSHAGPGAAHDGGTAGATYDSVYLPYQSGGGGAYENTPGGAGGGVLVAKVGELVLNGTIAARGDKRGMAYPNRGGAGAGGSIVIDAGIVRGSGSIDASGGDNEACDWFAGAGGGGRVALYAGSLVSFAPETQIKSWGGGIYYCQNMNGWRYAGAGTVFVKTSSSTYGALYVDSGAETNGLKRLGPDVKLPDLGTGSVTAVEVAGADLWITQAASFKSAWLGARMVLIGATGQELGSFPILQVAGNRVLLAGAGTTSGAATFRGEYRFDAVAVRNNARVVIPDALTAADLEVRLGEVRLPARVEVTNMTVRNGATAQAAGGDLGITVTDTLRVETGGTLSANSSGYAGAATSSVKGGAPAGLLGSATDTGGSHGGPGAPHDGGIPGETYDSVYVPTLGGGGGSFENTSGGAGGGALRVRAGTAIVDGVISALGEKRGMVSTHRGGAGGGGSVVLEVATLQGSGRIDASGGSNEACDWFAGAGGGGRVAVYADTLSFDPVTQMKAWGGGIYYCQNMNGWRYAGAGTVFVKSGSSTYGSLYVDSGLETNNTKRLGADVLLPVLGTGAVTAIEVSGSNLWVTQSTAFKSQWLGAWMVLVDGAGVDLGGFRVQEVSGNRVLLTGASAVTGAATFRGEYRFDAMTVRNGARVVAPDQVMALDFEAKSGEMWLPSKTVVRNLTIRNGASVMAAGEVLDLTVTEVLTIDSGGLLSATGKGYPGAATSSAQGGAPAGVTGSTSDTGGSHGGPGAAHDGGTAGATYDSVYLPYQAGGGGSYESLPGGAGGGVLVLKVGELVLNGTIASRGDKRGNVYPNRGGAGAGGSIVIDAGIVRGSGLIDASGGDNEACEWWSGAGGGGRVALYAGSLVSFAPETQIKSWGGGIYYCQNMNGWRYAGAGTVFVKTSSSTYGALYIDSGTETNGLKRLGADVKLPDLGTGTVTTVEVAGADLWVTTGQTLKAAWLGARMVLFDATGGDLGSFQVLRLDGARALLAGAAAVTSASTYEGEYRFDSIAARNDAKVIVPGRLAAQQLEIQRGDVRLPRLVKAQNLTVQATATLTANESVLRLVIPGTLTVAAGGKLSATASGYPGAATSSVAGGMPPLVSGPTSDFGGSHAGVGAYQDVLGTVGATYGSVYFPTLPGGGGSFESTNGGAGGGAIDLTAGEVVVEGTIESRGAKRGYAWPYRGAAGAGGSILIDTPLLRGAGLIDASGGDNEACEWWSGAGGGGRVALHADVLTGFDPAVQVRTWGGGVFHCGGSSWSNRYAGAGTIFVRTATATHGKLYAIQRPLSSVATPTTLLPVVGTGNIGTATPDTAVPADLWVEPQNPAALFPVGAAGLWLRIAGTDYRVLAEQPDRRHLLLQGASGLVGTGDAYAGIYKFDAVTVNGQFTLQTNDVVEPGTVTLGGGAQFVHP